MANLENDFNAQAAELNNDELDTSQDYLATIAEMKKNSVAKTEYDKLRQENRNLLQTIAEGGQLFVENPVVKTPADINALRKELFSENSGLSNLQYIEKTLELRDALIENGEPDPFLPVSSKNAPTNEEILQAEKVAEAFRSCVEYADGDSQIFTQELMRITNDSRPMPGNSRRR